MDFNSIIQTGMLLAAVITIIVSYLNSREQNRLMLYAEYTRRYQDIILNMPDCVYDGLPIMYSQTERYMRLYFDLCSEEFHLWKGGAIPNSEWKLWKEGMQMETKKDIYIMSWDKLKTYYAPPFIDFFDTEVIKK